MGSPVAPYNASQEAWRSHYAAVRLCDLARRIESPHADKIFVAKDFSKRQLADELRAIAESLHG